MLSPSQENPRSEQGRIDTYLIFTLAMSLFAVLPVLAHPGLFLGHDTLHHLFRVAEVSRAWEQGILLPRWAETFYFGYGSPVFSYYAPLTYYAAALPVRLFGLDAAGAIRLLVILCFPVMASGMYLFMRGQVRRLGGALSALVYLYSPYIVFTEPVTRGDYPELLAFALLPWVMGCFARVLRTGRGQDVALAALMSAVFLLAHNLMSPLLFALLLGWLMWLRLWSVIRWRQLGVGLLAAGLGVGLVGFFWLPIFLERGAVQLGNVPANIQSEQRNFFGFFVPLDRLLAPLPLTDAGAANGILLRLNLGLAQWLLALLGIASTAFFWLRRIRFTSSQSDIPSTQHLALCTYFALAALAMLLFMLPLSYGLWSSLPLLNFMEFPWRLLGPMAFCLAVLAGLSAVWIERLPARISSVVGGALLAAPVLLALPALYIPSDRALDVDITQAAYLQAEITGQISPGTSARNDFLPRDVLVLPGATQSLLDDYGDGYPVNKVNPNSIPVDSTVTVIDHTPQSDTWAVQAAAPFTLETFTFNFPGWTAEIDGQPLPITASQPHGFISLPIPAGDHTVHLYLSQTPARNLGVIVTLVSIVGLILIVVVRRDVQLNTPQLATGNRQLPTAHWQLLTTFLLTTLLVALLMREGIAWANSPPGEARLVTHPTVYHLGEDIQVLGYDVSAQTVRPGDWLEVVIYWYPVGQPHFNYSSFVHLSTGGAPLAQADKPYPGGRATREWTPDGRHLRDAYSLHLPDNIPPGDYQLTVGLYTCDTRPAGECGNGDRLPVTDAGGNPLGDIVPLGTIQVRP
jgi:hypothetical protein